MIGCSVCLWTLACWNKVSCGSVLFSQNPDENLGAFNYRRQNQVAGYWKTCRGIAGVLEIFSQLLRFSNVFHFWWRDLYSFLPWVAIPSLPIMHCPAAADYSEAIYSGQWRLSRRDFPIKIRCRSCNNADKISSRAFLKGCNWHNNGGNVLQSTVCPAFRGLGKKVMRCGVN
jgi:hypothetical protein